MKNAEQKLAVLLDLAATLPDTDSLGAALRVITDAALRVVPADHASVRLLDPSETLLVAGARSGRGTHLGSLPLRRGEGVAGWVLETGEPACIADVTVDPRFVAAMGQGFAIRSILAEPLWRGGRVVGVLSASSAEPGAFGADDVRIARLLASCSIVAVDRAHHTTLEASDELTMALRARHLERRLKPLLDEARASMQPISMLAMDLDDLEQVNATFGREVGDRVLCAFADRVRAASRVFDVLARGDGDEFFLVMPSIDTEPLRAFGERIRTAIGDVPIEPLPGALITQRVSLGGAVWDRLESPAQWLTRATAALNEAKVLGGDRCVVAMAARPIHRAR